VAAGRAGGDPLRRPRTTLVLPSPSPEPENPTRKGSPGNDDNDMYTAPERRPNPVTGRPPLGATSLPEGHIATYSPQRKLLD